jgi:hypothetical protein
VAITYGATGAAAYDAGSGVLTLAKPSGVAPGDLLLAYCQNAYTAGPSCTPPAGWSLKTTAIPDGIDNYKAYLFWKIAGASEPGSYTFYCTAYTCGVIRSYKGANGLNGTTAYTVADMPWIYTVPGVAETYQPGEWYVLFASSYDGFYWASESPSLNNVYYDWFNGLNIGDTTRTEAPGAVTLTWNAGHNDSVAIGVTITTAALVSLTGGACGGGSGRSAAKLAYALRGRALSKAFMRNAMTLFSPLVALGSRSRAAAASTTARISFGVLMLLSAAIGAARARNRLTGIITWTQWYLADGFSLWAEGPGAATIGGFGRSGGTVDTRFQLLGMTAGRARAAFTQPTLKTMVLARSGAIAISRAIAAGRLPAMARSIGASAAVGAIGGGGIAMATVAQAMSSLRLAIVGQTKITFSTLTTGRGRTAPRGAYSGALASQTIGRSIAASRIAAKIRTIGRAQAAMRLINAAGVVTFIGRSKASSWRAPLRAMGAAALAMASSGNVAGKVTIATKLNETLLGGLSTISALSASTFGGGHFASHAESISATRAGIRGQIAFSLRQNAVAHAIAELSATLHSRAPGDDIDSQDRRARGDRIARANESLRRCNGVINRRIGRAHVNQCAIADIGRRFDGDARACRRNVHWSADHRARRSEATRPGGDANERDARGCDNRRGPCARRHQIGGVNAGHHSCERIAGIACRIENDVARRDALYRKMVRSSVADDRRGHRRPRLSWRAAAGGAGV